MIFMLKQTGGVNCAWVLAQDVAERRGKVRKYNTDPEYKKQIDEDKRARAAAQRKADPPLSQFDIVIPLAPFGIPGAKQASFIPTSYTMR